MNHTESLLIETIQLLRKQSENQEKLIEQVVQQSSQIQLLLMEMMSDDEDDSEDEGDVALKEQLQKRKSRNLDDD